MVNITDIGPYNMENVSNSKDILEFVIAVNALTDHTFMLGILIVGWFILFLSMRGYGNKEALTASSFITSVMAIFFVTLGFISVTTLLFIVIPAAFMFAAILFRKD
jgi:hypothetical protein|tara:strand:- start:226 stop:543 length:318 start_codon:yes stop_codon:yes gene_type:complete